MFINRRNMLARTNCARCTCALTLKLTLQAAECWTVAFGNAFNDEERCVLAGYANGDLRSGPFHLHPASSISECTPHVVTMSQVLAILPI